MPKTIWMLWLQGWAEAPRIVKACRRSWELNNPDWTILCLDRATVGAYIENDEARSALSYRDQPAEACSDRLRVALLEQHGGVWVDATTYCLRPLDEWLDDVLTGGFFAFDRPGPDRLLASWFLASAPGHYVMTRWSQMTMEYWRERRQRHHYFWFHYLFGEACASDREFRRVYELMPKVSADGPHYYVPQDEKLRVAVTERDEWLIETPTLPLVKLSHRLADEDYRYGSVAEYLCRRLGT